jgi:hypothetical protein
LGVAAFNALFTGEEWHEFATPPIGPGATQRDAAGIERTLLALNALVAASSRGDPDSQAILKVEDHLAVVRFSYALGVQRRNWVEQSELLERATSMLLRALVTNPACRTGKPTEQGKIRRNIFEQYYVARLQPELARQGQPDRGWVRAVAVLVNSTLAAGADSGTTWPQAEAVERWHQAVLGEHPESEYGRWKYAIAAHTSAWQRQLGLCGLMPGV